MVDNKVDVYTTIAGDTWDMIAYKVYKNEYYMDELMDANPELLDFTIFPAGIMLICPDISAVELSVLPPWKEED